MKPIEKLIHENIESNLLYISTKHYVIFNKLKYIYQKNN